MIGTWINVGVDVLDAVVIIFLLWGRSQLLSAHKVALQQAKEALAGAIQEVEYLRGECDDLRRALTVFRPEYERLKERNKVLEDDAWQTRKATKPLTEALDAERRKVKDLEAELARVKAENHNKDTIIGRLYQSLAAAKRGEV